MSMRRGIIVPRILFHVDRGAVMDFERAFFRSLRSEVVRDEDFDAFLAAGLRVVPRSNQHRFGDAAVTMHRAKPERSLGAQADNFGRIDDRFAEIDTGWAL